VRLSLDFYWDIGACLPGRSSADNLDKSGPESRISLFFSPGSGEF